MSANGISAVMQAANIVLNSPSGPRLVAHCQITHETLGPLGVKEYTVSDPAVVGQVMIYIQTMMGILSNSLGVSVTLPPQANTTPDANNAPPAIPPSANTP